MVSNLKSNFSAWKFIKLLEVTVSPDPKNGYAPGHINLVENRFVVVASQIYGWEVMGQGLRS